MLRSIGLLVSVVFFYCLSAAAEDELDPLLQGNVS